MSAKFSRLVLTRIHESRLFEKRQPALDEPWENDLQWKRIFDLHLLQRRDKVRLEISCMGYGITGGSLNLSFRGHVAGYVLRRWSFDCSPNHGLSGPQRRLWLRDHFALSGGKGPGLGLGYQPTALGAEADG